MMSCLCASRNFRGSWAPKVEKRIGESLAKASSKVAKTNICPIQYSINRKLFRMVIVMFIFITNYLKIIRLGFNSIIMEQTEDISTNEPNYRSALIVRFALIGTTRKLNLRISDLFSGTNKNKLLSRNSTARESNSNRRVSL